MRSLFRVVFYLKKKKNPKSKYHHKPLSCIMLTAIALMEYYNWLDCSNLSPTIIFQTHYGWNTVYDWTIEQYNNLKEHKLLSGPKLARLLIRMQKHAASQNHRQYFKQCCAATGNLATMSLVDNSKKNPAFSSYQIATISFKKLQNL